MPEGTCTSCRFYDPYTGLCCNGCSDHYRAFMPNYAVCNEYTAIEEEDDGISPDA